MPVRKPATPKTPILDKLIVQGHIALKGTDIVGMASDGVVVTLGSTDDFLGGVEQVEIYLREHPTPADW